MKVLLLGDDGRAHALAWKLFNSPLVDDLICAPGNGGTAPLVPAAVIRTVRQAYNLCRRDGKVLAEVADDRVSVLDGRRTSTKFREIEVERVGGAAKTLDRVEALLLKAGAWRGHFTPKHLRAMGQAATGRKKATAGEVVVAAVRRDIERIFGYEPFVRLREPLDDGDTPVHQMRVGVRRLRSDLRTFGPLLEKAWARRMRTELGWLADALGAVRDAEVLRARLHATARADPLAPLDEAAVARIDAELTVRHEESFAALDQLLRSPRYLALLDELIETARAPRLLPEADKRARYVLLAVVVKPWRKLVYGGGAAPGAGGLVPESTDEEWHTVRIRGKRARYATQAVAATVGDDGSQALATALGKVQDLLGEHQDAVVAADTWLGIAKTDPDDHALAVTAGRLYERERAAVLRARSNFPAVWRDSTKKRITRWLR